MLNKNHYLWSLAFRPFFTICIFLALTIILIWVAMLSGGWQYSSQYFNSTQWHAHEMIFGFAWALIIGFVLTASRNWANTRGMHGRLLQCLAVTFLISRAVFLWGSFTTPLWYLIFEGISSLLFIGYYTQTIWNRRRLPFQLIILGILLSLFGFNVLFIVSREISWAYVAVGLIRLLIGVVACRLVPFFTRGGAGLNIQTPQPLVMTHAMALMLLTAAPYLDDVFITNAISVTHILALVGFLTGSFILYSWKPWRCLHQPMLTILHAGYLWLLVHLLLLASQGFFLASTSSVYLHTFTYGCLGSFAVGMMARVSYGHTGRMIVASKFALTSFVLLQFGTVIRVFVPLMMPAWTYDAIIMSGTLWVVAFGSLAIDLVPILSTARVDGKEV